MWDLAVREADYQTADSLVQRYARSRGEAPLSYRVLLAYAGGDSTERERLRAAARTADNRQPQIAGRYLATYLEDLPAARELASFSLVPERRAPLRAGAHLLVAWVEIAGGRWGAARQAFAAAEPLDPAATLVNRAMAAVLPFLAPPSSDLHAIHAAVERWDPAADPADPRPGLAAALRPHLRWYLLGLLDARLGRTERALDAVRQLEAAGATARAMAQTVRAEVQARQGRATDALRTLEAVNGEVPLDLVNLPMFATVREYAQEHGRFLRAALLAEQRRDAEALRWLENAFRGAPNEFAFRAPAYRLRGEIYERMGDRERAIESYRRFLTLWQECDAELQPRLREVEDRLARLASPR